jgi:hypothetical protein
MVKFCNKYITPLDIIRNAFTKAGFLENRELQNPKRCCYEYGGKNNELPIINLKTKE